MAGKQTYEESEKRVKYLEKQIAECRVLETGANHQLRTLLDFAPYPIVVFTMDGLVSYLNPAFTEIFGWTLDELEGKKIPYVPPDLEKEIPHDIKRLFDRHRHSVKRPPQLVSGQCFIGSPGAFACRFNIHENDRIDFGIITFDALQIKVEQLQASYLFAADQGNELFCRSKWKRMHYYPFLLLSQDFGAATNDSLK